MSLWINHPRTGRPSPSITFSVYTLIVILIKVLISGVIIDGVITFQETEASLILALLSPVMAALVGSKHIDINGGKAKPASEDA